MSGAADWPRALALAERAEALGLHSVWLPEGHFAPGATPAPLLVLSAVAARTRRLVLATTSLLLPVRPPRRVAAEVSTLDRLSGGRVWLGLGRGFRAPLFEAFGVPAGEKRDRFDAALDAILAAWAAAPPGARPLQKPHPPLLVAAFGRRGLLQAARRGLPYLASPLEGADALAANFAYHREHLAPGVDADRLPVAAIRTLHVAADDAEAARVREALAAEARRMAPHLPASVAGSVTRQLAERGDPRPGVLPAALVGTAPAVAEALAGYRERVGLDLVVVRPAAPATGPEGVEASLERLVEEVLPALGRAS